MFLPVIYEVGTSSLLFLQEKCEVWQHINWCDIALGCNYFSVCLLWSQQVCIYSMKMCSLTAYKLVWYSTLVQLFLCLLATALAMHRIWISHNPARIAIVLGIFCNFAIILDKFCNFAIVLDIFCHSKHTLTFMSLGCNQWELTQELKRLTQLALAKLLLIQIW